MPDNEMRIAFDSYAELLPLKKLVKSKHQRNKHPKDQIERLAKIMLAHGVRHPIHISKLSGQVCFGHGRWEAAKLNGWDKYPVVYQDFKDEDEEYACVQSDNAIAHWAELDLSSINNDLGNLGPDFDIDLLGIKDFVLEPAEKFEAQCDEDEVPAQVDTRCKLGDVWQLGRHRLVCGDSTDVCAVDLLMAGEKADMVFTDPPYGMNAVSKDGTLGGGKGEHKKVYRPIIGDSGEFDAGFLLTVEAEQYVIWGGNFLAHKFPRGTHWIVWDKRGAEMKGGSEAGTQSDCELAWTNLDRNSVKKYVHVWAGWFRAGNKKDELTTKVHPTQKPVGLCVDIFNDYLKDEQTVLDLFGGSGSTLIACEKTNRRCFMMELDPHYCDVILARWEKYTGQAAERLDEGKEESRQAEAGHKSRTGKKPSRNSVHDVRNGKRAKVQRRHARA
jgi:DNA modification methylase